MTEEVAEASHQSSALDPDSKATHSALSGYLDTDDLISAADELSVRDASQNALSRQQGNLDYYLTQSILLFTTGHVLRSNVKE